AVGIDDDFDGAGAGAERVQIGRRVEVIMEVDNRHDGGEEEILSCKNAHGAFLCQLRVGRYRQGAGSVRTARKPGGELLDCADSSLPGEPYTLAIPKAIRECDVMCYWSSGCRTGLSPEPRHLFAAQRQDLSESHGLADH